GCAGCFPLAAHAPATLAWWPGDARLRVTSRLDANALEMQSRIDNPGTTELPFGLGFHPYLRVPFFPRTTGEEYVVLASACFYWELDDSLPTGRLLPVDAARNLLTPRRFPELSLDDLLSYTPSA